MRDYFREKRFLSGKKKGWERRGEATDKKKQNR